MGLEWDRITLYTLHDFPPSHLHYTDLTSWFHSLPFQRFSLVQGLCRVCFQHFLLVFNNPLWLCLDFALDLSHALMTKLDSGICFVHETAHFLSHQFTSVIDVPAVRNKGAQSSKFVAKNIRRAWKFWRLSDGSWIKKTELSACLHYMRGRCGKS